jgi:hypothetical protein
LSRSGAARSFYWEAGCGVGGSGLAIGPVDGGAAVDASGGASLDDSLLGGTAGGAGCGISVVSAGTAGAGSTGTFS